jgi:hypothetical protein
MVFHVTQFDALILNDPISGQEYSFVLLTRFQEGDGREGEAKIIETLHHVLVVIHPLSFRSRLSRTLTHHPLADI